jgi:hypothetical protein
MTNKIFHSHRTPRLKNTPWLETFGAVIILVIAWLYGFFTTSEPVRPLVPNVLPGTHIVETEGEIYIAYEKTGRVIGYAATAEATGYGGPTYLLVGVDPQGVIIGIQIIEQRETPGFFTLLRDNRFVQQFLGLSPTQPLDLGQDIDGVSGATLSAQAVADAVWRSVIKIRSDVFIEAPTRIQFGLPEITLIILYLGTILLPRLGSPNHKNIFRWVLLLISMVVLGFIINEPLTVANFASLLVGYWPTWQNHLYWYILLVGVIGSALVTGRNYYCYLYCPFGPVQDILGKMGSAKPYQPHAAYQRLKWVPRWLAVLALALGLAFRQPGAASFEPFGTLFSFSAGFFPWMLLVIVLFASMLFLRPFCYYLCPVKPVIEFFILIRRQAKQLWKNR